MKITALSPDEIVVGDRLRGLDQDTVDRLKTSIETLGLKTPISVRFLSGDEGWLLVAGRHRLQACIELGMGEIAVRVETGSETDARMWEIAENLHRADLTVLERGNHIAEWVRLSEAKKEAQVAPPGGVQPQDKGIRAAVSDLGIDRTEAQRALKIDALPPEVKTEAKILHLDDNQSALLKAARAPSKEEQLRALREHAQRPRSAPVPAARDPLNDLETVEHQVDVLIAAWNKAGPEAREKFLERIDRPVAENTVALRA